MTVFEMTPKQKVSNDHRSLMCACALKSCFAISPDRRWRNGEQINLCYVYNVIFINIYIIVKALKIPTSLSLRFNK
jgi:hypothetical protein